MSVTNDPRFMKTGDDISFTFDNTPVRAVLGQSIAAALTAAGIVAIRSERSGKPAGLYCGMGACQECLVSVDGAAGVRACLTPVSDAMEVRSQDYAVSQNLVRSADPFNFAAFEHCDVVIVGAGPAGLAAAIGVSGHGLSVTVVDERHALGGQFFKPLAKSHAFATGTQIDEQYSKGAAFAARLQDTDTKVLLGATVWNVERDEGDHLRLYLQQDGKTKCLSARRLVLATGAHERAPPFPGWTLPGVMTTGAAQGLLRSYRVVPGRAILIAGNGPLNFQLAAELIESGANVCALVEAAPAPVPGRILACAGALATGFKPMMLGAKYVRKLRRAGVPIYHGHTIIQANGTRRVTCAVIAPCNNRSNPLTLHADAVCLGYGFASNNEIARLIGCEFQGAEPKCNKERRTSQDDVFVIGDCGKFLGAQAAIAEGQILAAAIVKDLCGKTVDPSRALKDFKRQRRFQKHLWSLFRAEEIGLSLADADTVICRCEGITRGQLATVIDQGVQELGRLKRLSRAGMGRCQGRNCAHRLGALLHRSGAGRDPVTTDHFTPQAPLKPLGIGAFSTEQPEWRGYKTVDVALPAPREARRSGLDIICDGLIIGGGIIGLSAAYFLAQAGHEICLIEAGEIGSQASGANAGSLHLQLLSFDADPETLRVDSPACRTLTLQKQGIELWQSLAQNSGTDLEFAITGGLMVAQTAAQLKLLEAKIKCENAVGVSSHLINARELQSLFPAVSPDMVGATFCPGEGKINPLLATQAMYSRVRSLGIDVLSANRVLAIEESNGTYSVKAEGGRVRARYIVNAAGGWARKIAGLAGVDLPVRSAPQQMVVTEPCAPFVSHLVSHASRHLTLKQAANGNVIIGGGWFAGFDEPGARTRILARALAGNLWAAQQVAPVLNGVNIIRSWAATGVMIDGAPILGEVPGTKGFFNAVGANGFTMGPLMGKITADLVCGKAAPAAFEDFSLSRF